MSRIPVAVVALGLAASAAACAPPGDTPPGTPPSTVTVHMSAYFATPPVRAGQPSLVGIVPGQVVQHCGDRPAGRTQPARPVGPQPTASLSDAQKRAERALEAANPPTPLRAPIPADALSAAETCVQLLQMELTLLGASGDLTPQRLRDHLAREGLKAAVRPDLSFTGRVGAACIYGTLADTKPSFELGPRNADGSC